MLTLRKHFVMAFAATLLGGCAHPGHNVVGAWDIKGGPGPASITFTSDGNFKTEATMPGRSSTFSGQYHLDGDTLTLMTIPQRTATLRWNTNDEAIMTGDDGKAMTLARRK